MVTRYDLTEEVDTGRLDITPVPDGMGGRYVTFEDYQKLKEEFMGYVVRKEKEINQLAKAYAMLNGAK